MSQAGQATSSSLIPGVVDFLAGNTGGLVGPNAGNTINIVGSGSITVAGNPGTNTLTISTSALSETWHLIGASQTLVPNNGYICISGGTLSLLLPAVSSVGDIIEITLDGSTGFSITQGAQSIRLANDITTFGAGGSISSTKQGDTVRMVCQIANTKWNVLSSMGNLTII